jgi:hypothetical protein
MWPLSQQQTIRGKFSSLVKFLGWWRWMIGMPGINLSLACIALLHLCELAAPGCLPSESGVLAAVRRSWGSAEPSDLCTSPTTVSSGLTRPTYALRGGASFEPRDDDPRPVGAMAGEPPDVNDTATWAEQLFSTSEEESVTPTQDDLLRRELQKELDAPEVDMDDLIKAREALLSGNVSILFQHLARTSAQNHWRFVHLTDVRV